MADTAPSETRFFWPVRVYYEDTDAGGVVYYANYLRFFERARTERLREIGFEQDELRERSGVLFAVRSVQAEYLKPARFNDALRVSAEISELRRASISFSQQILRGDELICEAAIRIACLTDGELKPTAIPDDLMQRIKDVL
ncbi:tol-pal system-associated acyl-CoA thioesterase [Methylococcus sp. EFPC2]|uniref:tol-pal system-associated acyl-CoA thioesterase n=1 Tax=Methylococcus sp. EFPC2 TaxID=2812648 RepID=UPI001967AFA3|nr:tol-pal system-associated acyl-CoA thioesterase [Methylococcus sp. EFPC2]QSA95800.1 tol-pal system-associated acyl-CoA thioesterase [Methylococcus sp. EFPC2]